MALLQADASGDAVDLKISSTSLMDPGLEEFLSETSIRGLWVETPSVLLEKEPASVLKRISSLLLIFEVFPVVGSADLVALIVAKHLESRT